MKKSFCAFLGLFFMLSLIFLYFHNITEASAASELDTPRISYPSDGDELELDDITIRWSSVSGADYYKLSILDITDNSKLINKEVTGTSYKLSSSKLTSGHEIKVAVGAYSDEGAESYWDDIRFHISQPNSFLPYMNNFAINKSKITIGDNVSFSGTINGNGGIIEKVTVNIQGPDDRTFAKQYTTLSPNTSSFSMSNISSFTAGAEWMKSPGKYWVEVWARNKNGEGVLVSEIQVNVNYSIPLIQSAEILTKEAKVGDEIKFIAETNISTDKLLLTDYTGAEIYSWTTGTTVKGDKKIWNISKSINTEGEKQFFFFACNAQEKSLQGIRVTFNILPNNMKLSEFKILTPNENNKNSELNKSLKISWEAPQNGLDSTYNIYLYFNNKIVHEKTNVSNTIYALPTDALNIAGNYYIEIYATKNGWAPSMASANFIVVNPISDWGKKALEDIIANNLITDDLVNELSYAPKDNLTRAEFCEMLVQVYDSYENQVISFNPKKVKNFQDLVDLPQRTVDNIKKANALGIISGTSDSTFEPSSHVDRQTLATMLRNTYYAIYGYDIDMSQGKWANNFGDVNNIQPWAVESVRFSNALGILVGDGLNYDPTELANREMGFALISRAHEKFNDFSANMECEIDAYTSIKNYTPYILKCSYNNTLIGTVNNKKVKWSIDNTTIASLNETGLTAKGTGKVRLSARYNDIFSYLELNINKPINMDNTTNNIETFNTIINHANIGIKENNYAFYKNFSIDKKEYKLIYLNREKTPEESNFKPLGIKIPDKIPEPSYVIDENNKIVTDIEIIRKIDMMLVIQEDIYSKKSDMQSIIAKIDGIENGIKNYLFAQDLIFAGNHISGFLGKLTYETFSDPSPAGKLKTAEILVETLKNYSIDQMDASTADELGKKLAQVVMCKSYTQSLNEIRAELNKVIDLVSDKSKVSDYDNCLFINNSLGHTKAKFDNTWAAIEVTYLPNLPESKLDAISNIFGGFLMSFGESVTTNTSKKYFKDNKDVANNIELLKIAKDTANTIQTFQELVGKYYPNYSIFLMEGNNIDNNYINYYYIAYPNTNRIELWLSKGIESAQR